MFNDIKNKSLDLALHLIPLTTSLIFILFGTFTWPIPFWGTIAPSFGLSAVFYWSIYRPDLFRPMTVFVLGLLNDVIHFLPIGLSAAVFLSVHQLSYSNRRFFVGQIFYMLWTGFIIASIFSMILIWCVMSIYNGKFVPIIPVIIQNVITIILFPLPAWILIKIQRVFLSREKV